MRIALALIGALALCLVLAIGAVVVSMDWLVVSIDERGPGAVRLWIPVPVGAAQLALALVTVVNIDEHMPAVPEFAEFRLPAGQAIDILDAAGDAELPAVRDGDERVSIRKVGRFLLLDVEDGGEQVRIRVPIEVLRGVLNAYDGERFNVATLVSTLGDFPSGEIVHVREPDTEVRISIW